MLMGTVRLALFLLSCLGMLLPRQLVAGDRRHEGLLTTYAARTETLIADMAAFAESDECGGDLARVLRARAGSLDEELEKQLFFLRALLRCGPPERTVDQRNGRFCVADGPDQTVRCLGLEASAVTDEDVTVEFEVDPTSDNSGGGSARALVTSDSNNHGDGIGNKNNITNEAYSSIDALLAHLARDYGDAPTAQRLRRSILDAVGGALDEHARLRARAEPEVGDAPNRDQSTDTDSADQANEASKVLVLGSGLARLALDLAESTGAHIVAADASELQFCALRAILNDDGDVGGDEGKAEIIPLLGARSNLVSGDARTARARIDLSPFQRLGQGYVTIARASLEELCASDALQGRVDAIVSSFFTDVAGPAAVLRCASRLLAPNGVLVHFGPLQCENCD